MIDFEDNFGITEEHYRLDSPRKMRHARLLHFAGKGTVGPRQMLTATLSGWCGSGPCLPQRARRPSQLRPTGRFQLSI